MIQTRVDEDLEQTLKREAARRRLTVSHLIRNTLEDAFDLVQGVSKDVEQLVSGSVELAATVKRDAKRIASIVRGGPASGERPPTRSETKVVGQSARRAAAANTTDSPAAADAETQSTAGVADAETQRNADAEALAHVYGWNRVIANRAAQCVKCGAGIDRGDEAWVGLSDQAMKPGAWLCPACAEKL